MPDEPGDSKRISEMELQATLTDMLASETELNEIIGDISTNPDTNSHFGPIEHYSESLANVRIIIKLIRMRLTITDD